MELPEAIRPELDPTLIEQTELYIAAVDGGDLATQEAFYAPDFVNIRYDRSGKAVNLPLDVFLGVVRGWASEGGGDTPPPPPAERTEIIATSHYADCASVLLSRVKGGETIFYNFVWQQHDGRWLVLREFTLHDKLPGT